MVQAQQFLTVVGAFGLFFLAIGTAVAALQFAASLALMKYKPWARIAIIVLSCLSLLAFPIGTLLGGYSLWVLFHRDTVTLFSPSSQAVDSSTPS